MSRGTIIPLACGLLMASAHASFVKADATKDAAGATAPATPGDEPTPLTDAEKRVLWVGEKVTLLGTRALACPTQEKAEVYFLRSYDNKGKRRLLESAYVGQPGVVVETGASSSPMPEVVVQLDKTGEKVTCSGDQGLAFQSELESARQLVGRSLWSRGPQTLTPEGQLCLGLEAASRDSRLPLGNLQKVTVTRVELGHHLQPTYLLLQTEDGKSGWLTGWDGYDYFDERYHVSSGRPVESRPYSFRFHTEDPRQSHPDWPAADWQRIESDEVAAGMTWEMARMACGREIKPVEPSLLPPGGEAPRIFECNCEKLLVENGKVVGSVETPEPKLTEAANGFDLAVLSIERKGEQWQSGGLIFSAKKKGEIVVVHLRVRRGAGQGRFEAGPPELVTSDGARGESPTLSLRIDLAGNCRRGEFDLAFSVVKGSRLKTLRVAGATFGLETLGFD